MSDLGDQVTPPSTVFQMPPRAAATIDRQGLCRVDDDSRDASCHVDAAAPLRQGALSVRNDGRAELHPVACTRRNGRGDRFAPPGDGGRFFTNGIEAKPGEVLVLAPEAAVLNECRMALVGAIGLGCLAPMTSLFDVQPFGTVLSLGACRPRLLCARSTDLFLVAILRSLCGHHWRMQRVSHRRYADASPLLRHIR